MSTECLIVRWTKHMRIAELEPHERDRFTNIFCPDHASRGAIPICRSSLDVVCDNQSVFVA